MPSRMLTDLDPRIQKSAYELKALWIKAGLQVLITCTRRSREEQEALYAQGRTVPGKIVTYTKPGTSMHEKGLALDFVPLFMGKPDWLYTPDDPKDHWDEAAQIAKDSDPRISWGGDWKRFKDRPHLEWRLEA